MTGKKILIGVIGIFAVCVISILVVFNPLKKDIWDVNAKGLKDSFNIISGNAVIDDLSQFTSFEWDTLYSFTSYTSKEKIYETIGYKWDNISETVNEGMNQIVFVKDNEVVCYIYGYPENTKIGFDFGQYEGSYIKLTADQILSFEMIVTKDGVRYLKYIK